MIFSYCHARKVLPFSVHECSKFYYVYTHVCLSGQYIWHCFISGNILTLIKLFLHVMCCSIVYGSSAYFDISVSSFRCYWYILQNFEHKTHFISVCVKFG